MRIRLLHFIFALLIITFISSSTISLAQTRTFSPPIYRLDINEPEQPPRGTPSIEYIGPSEKGSGGDYDEEAFHPAKTVFFPIERISFFISWKGEATPIGALLSPSGQQSTIQLDNECTSPVVTDPYCIPEFIGGYGMELGEYQLLLIDQKNGRSLNKHSWRVEYPKKPFVAQYRLENGKYLDLTTTAKAVAIMGFAPHQQLTINFYCPGGNDKIYYGEFIAQRTFATGSDGALYIELGQNLICGGYGVATMVEGYSPDYSYTYPDENFGGTQATSDDYPLVPSRQWIYIDAELIVKAESNNTYPVFSKPSIHSSNIDLVEQEKLTLLDGPVLADGEYWWSVITNKGINGWMREIDLFSIYYS